MTVTSYKGIKITQISFIPLWIFRAKCIFCKYNLGFLGDLAFQHQVLAFVTKSITHSLPNNVPSWVSPWWLVATHALWHMYTLCHIELNRNNFIVHLSILVKIYKKIYRTFSKAFIGIAAANLMEVKNWLDLIPMPISRWLYSDANYLLFNRFCNLRLKGV